MRSGTRLELRQLVSFVVVAVVLNAQFTWWVYHSLRDNRERLDLERVTFARRVEVAASRIRERVQAAEADLLKLPPNVIPPMQPPIVEVQVTSDQPAGTLPDWVSTGGRAAYARALGRGRWALAFIDPQAPYRWLSGIDADLQIVEVRTAEPSRPSMALAAPFEHLAVAPDFHRWSSLLDNYRQRVVLVLSEGVFFVAAMITAVILLWRVVRRESLLEHQHQNFVSAVTHELKTPIAGIRLALETVLSGRVDEDGRKRFLGNALADAERLSGLVEKILEVTRYAGGGRRLRVELGDLSSLVEEEVAVAARRAAARGAVIETDIAPEIQAPIDPEALAIVISNLLENALKYAQGAPPRVWVRLTLERGEAALEVRDDGIGIRASDLEEIFKPFVRAANEVTRRTPGTGIGLYVAHEIVVGHGGRLSATSEGPGKGATFRVVLPGADLIPPDDFSE